MVDGLAPNTLRASRFRIRPDTRATRPTYTTVPRETLPIHARYSERNQLGPAAIAKSCGKGRDHRSTTGIECEVECLALHPFTSTYTRDYSGPDTGSMLFPPKSRMHEISDKRDSQQRMLPMAESPSTTCTFGTCCPCALASHSRRICSYLIIAQESTARGAFTQST